MELEFLFFMVGLFFGIFLKIQWDKLLRFISKLGNDRKEKKEEKKVYKKVKGQFVEVKL